MNGTWTLIFEGVKNTALVPFSPILGDCVGVCVWERDGHLSYGLKCIGKVGEKVALPAESGLIFPGLKLERCKSL